MYSRAVAPYSAKSSSDSATPQSDVSPLDEITALGLDETSDTEANEARKQELLRHPSQHAFPIGLQQLTLWKEQERNARRDLHAQPETIETQSNSSPASSSS